MVSLNPDAIFLPTEMGQTPFYGSVLKLKHNRDGTQSAQCTTTEVYVINGDLFAEAGPRVADCVYAVAADLYPQLFNSTS